MQRGLDVNQEAIARAELQGSREAGKPTKNTQQDARSFSEGLAAFEKHFEGVHE